MRTGTAAALAAAAVLGLAGCSGEAGEAGEAGKTADVPRFSASADRPGEAFGTPAVTATGGAVQGVVLGSRRPADADAAAVHDAYVAFWRKNVAALRNPALASAVLDLTVDPQRARTLRQFDTIREKNQHAVGDLRIRPSGIRVEEGRATLRDCLDDSRMSLEDARGRPVPDSRGQAQVVAVTMIRAPGAWLVSDIKTRSGSC